MYELISGIAYNGIRHYFGQHSITSVQHQINCRIYSFLHIYVLALMKYFQKTVSKIRLYLYHETVYLSMLLISFKHKEVVEALYRY